MKCIAQAYGHAISRCATRDRLTQVLWRLADFRYRLRRQPQPLWLPETACDRKTLDLLIEQKLRFVVLAPGQAAKVKVAGSDEWQVVEDGNVDTSRAYLHLHRDGSGRSIACFFYHSNASRSIAFEKALTSSEALLGALVRLPERAARQCCDGRRNLRSSFQFGDLCLAHTLAIEARTPDSKSQTMVTF